MDSSSPHAPDDARGKVPVRRKGDARFEADATRAKRVRFSRFRDFQTLHEENFPPRPATCFRRRCIIQPAGDGRAVVRDQRRGAAGGGGIKAASIFLQAFSKSRLFLSALPNKL